MKAPITPAQAWAALAEHYGWAGGKAELSAGFGSINLGYTADQLQAYGLQCAAHAREMALNEAKLVAKTTCHHESTEFANGFNMAALNIESAIEALKGKR